MSDEKKESFPADLIDSIYPHINKVADEGRTTSRVTEDIYLCLVKNPKYRDQAHHLMYRIPIYRPTPYFEISKSDLTEDLHQELAMYGEKERNYIMWNAVGKIFEIQNEAYYFGSVAKLLKWRWTE